MYFSEEEKEKSIGIVKRFIISYAKNCNSEKRESLLEWLKKEFRRVFKEETNEEIKIRSENILRGVEQYYKEKQKVLEKKSKGLSSEKIITDEIVEVIENDDSTEEGINRLDNFKTSVEKSVEDYIFAKPKDILREVTRLEDSNLHILDVMAKVNAELKYGKVTVKPEVSAKFGFGLKSDLLRLTNIEGKGKLNVEYMW